MIRYELLDDTIAAISSPPGRSRRGIVRVSGPRAFAVAEHLFRAGDGDPLAARCGGTCVNGSVRLTELGAEAPAMALVFTAPHTYTGQDLVELHVAGSPPLLTMLLEALLAHGARSAHPGEFTARAYLNGRLDLTEAEAVATLIQARSDAELRAAERMLHGRLSTATRDLRERLADLLALVEAEIDFTEEPIDFISPPELQARVAEITAEIRSLLDHALSTERLEELPRILLVGAVNAGKSTLLNRLTGVPRAICSPLPGTTRDLLSAPMTLDGHEVLLIDSAGLFDAADPVDRAAVESTLAQIGRVDVVCHVIDASAPAVGSEEIPRPLRDAGARVIVLNKIDRPAARAVDAGHVPSERVCRVSALTGDGCQELLRTLSDMVHGHDATDVATSLPLTARQRQSLVASAECLDRAGGICAGLDAVADAAELVAFELREAVAEIGRVAGEVTTEDLLGRVFGRFCIGK